MRILFDRVGAWLFAWLGLVVVVVKANGGEEYAADERTARDVTKDVVRSCMIVYSIPLINSMDIPSYYYSRSRYYGGVALACLPYYEPFFALYESCRWVVIFIFTK